MQRVEDTIGPKKPSGARLLVSVIELSNEMPCLISTHCDILQNSLSRNNSAKCEIFFRENNLLIGHRVQHILGNSNFDQFGANLRKFHQYGLQIDTFNFINQLKHLPRIEQIGFY